MARYSFRDGKGLTHAERADIEAAVAAIDRLLEQTIQVDRTEAVETAAEMLFSNFKASRKYRDEDEQKADDQRVYDGFLIALCGASAAALQEAVRRLIRGKAQGLSKTFVPTSAELADLVDRVTAEWTSPRYRLERILKLDEELGDAETQTAARRRSSPSGGEIGRPVESVPTGTIYGRGARPSSKAEEGSR